MSLGHEALALSDAKACLGTLSGRFCARTRTSSANLRAACTKWPHGPWCCFRVWLKNSGFHPKTSASKDAVFLNLRVPVLGRSWGGFVLQEVLISSGECLLLPSSHLGGALETLPGSIPCKSLLGSVCG